MTEQFHISTCCPSIHILLPCRSMVCAGSNSPRRHSATMAARSPSRAACKPGCRACWVVDKEGVGGGHDADDADDADGNNADVASSDADELESATAAAVVAAVVGAICRKIDSSCCLPGARRAADECCHSSSARALRSAK